MRPADVPGRRAQVAAAMLVLLAASAVPAWAAPTVGGANPVVDGAFGAKTGFTSQYKATATLGDPQTYTLGLDPHEYNGNWPTIKPHDATGMMMIVNGATAANKIVWSETVPVKPNSRYVFSLWVASLYASPAVLRFAANGATLGSGAASSTVGAWKKLFFAWPSGSSTRVTLSLVDTNLAYGGNDFALGDIALTGPTAA
jgi:hypothetical protein